MTSSRFNLDLTLKTLNFFLLRFNERSGSKNLGFRPHKFCKSHLGRGFLGSIVTLVFILVLIKFYFKQKNKREILNNFPLTRVGNGKD